MKKESDFGGVFAAYRILLVCIDKMFIDLLIHSVKFVVGTTLNSIIVH